MKTSRELEAALYQKYGGNASTSQNANQQTTRSAGSRSEELGNALYEKYVVGGDANRQKVSNWVAKYNQTMKGISDYTKKRNGAYTDDPSGGYSNNVEELLNEFAEIRDYADQSGLPNAQRYYNSLLDLRDFLAQENEVLKAKEGMRAYEDEMIAAMERNEQLRKKQQEAAFGLDPATAMMMDFFFQKYTDYSHRAVTDQWTDEQRYRLGLMQMEDPAEAQKYATSVNAGQDPYLLYEQQEQQKSALRALDLNAEKREIDRMKSELNAYQNTSFDSTSASARKTYAQEVARREKEISDRERQYNLAKREQESAQLRSAVNNKDFSANSGYVSSGFEMPTYVEDADADELVYEYINNPEIRSKVDTQTIELAQKGYDLLYPEEVGIYNYYYATEGPAKAQQYLDNIQDTLNKRMGDRGAEAKDGQLWKQLLAGVVSGYSNAVTSIQYFFNKEDDYIDTTPFQYMSGAIREDLAETGKHPMFDTSLGQVAYDLVNTTANMAPSILLSTAANAVVPGSGAVIGSAAMGLSAAGGSYQQALNEGYTKEQARTYATLSGASEIALEYLLGGISKLGGEIPQKVLDKMISGVDKAISKAAITLGGSMVSEGFEEGLQEVITPWIENLTLYAGKNVNWNEVAYSTLLGALSGGVMEGPGVAVNTFRVSKIDKQLKDLGAKGNTLELAELIVKHRSGEQLSQEEYIKLVKSEPAMQILEGLRSAETGRNRLYELAAAKVEAEANASKAAEARPAAQTGDSASPAEAHPQAANGRAIQYSTQSGVEAHDFAEVKGGKDAKVTIQLKDGGTAELSDLTFESESEQDRFAAVASLPGIDTEHANDLLHTIQEAGAGLDLDSIVGIREAYRLGRMAASETELADSAASVLSPKLQGEIYAIGLDQSNAIAKAPINVRKTDAKPSKGYKKVIFEGEIVKPTDKKLQKKMESEIRFMDFIADKFSGTPVHVFQSYERDGKMYYTDNNGVEHAAPNGKYSNGEIWVDLNSGDTENGMVLNTFAHEMYHHIEKNNRAAANKLAEFVVKELGMKSVDAAVQKQIEKAREAGYGEEYFTSRGYSEVQAKNEVEMRAMSDFVADSLETMFTRGDVEGSVARLYNEDKGLFFKVKKFIDKWVKALKEFYGDKTISQEGYEVAQLERFEELQRMFMEAMKGAGENYRAALEALTPGKEGVVVDKNGDPVAMSTDDGSVMLSIRTYEEDGRKAFRNYLQKCVSSNRLTKAEMQEMIDGIEEVYQICKEFKDKYAPFSAWSDAEVIRDTRGRPVFSVVTPNGDYKMNLDFSLVCKKRRTLDAVFNEMSRRGIIDDFELGQKSVVKINEIIRKFQFETACSLCFVDARRFRQADVADSFVNLYNDLVQSLVPKDRQGEISRFNFGGVHGIESGEGITKLSDAQLDFSHINYVLKNYESGTVEHKAAKYIKANPNGRKLLMRGDFMSSKGFDAVKSQNADIMKLYNSKKGTGGPKAAFGDVQYLNEVIKKARWWTPKKAYEVGGVRIQSFSDYVPRMVFDYTQMIYDLAATKLPAHAYTKESLFVKQFGLTGVKINMSLIPAIAEGGIAPGLDANGNYVWAGESFNYDEAVKIQNADGYTENCGTICVGVSYDHIVKLLGDSNIRMVIPYHKSGLNPIVAHMNKIAEFTDYSTLKTNPGGCQSTMDSNGNKVENDFNFNEDLRKTRDPKQTARNYLAWCHDPKHNYTPKFAEFEWHENYYKLLIDFAVYDKNGNYVPQRGVKAVFPKDGSAFGRMKDLIRSGLEEDAEIEGRRNRDLNKIVDEIQRTLPKTEAEISEEQVAQADRDLEEQFSHRGKTALQDQTPDRTYMDAVKRGDKETAQKMVDEAARKAGYNSGRIYHGTPKFGFTWFDLGRMDDGISIFATSDSKIAESYSGETDRTTISDRELKNVNEMSDSELLKYVQRYIDSGYQIATNSQRKNLIERHVEAYDGIRQDVLQIIEDYGDIARQTEVNRLHELANILDEMSRTRDTSKLNALQGKVVNKVRGTWYEKEVSQAVQRVDESIEQIYYNLDEIAREETLFVTNSKQSAEYLPANIAREQLKGRTENGIYGLYAKMDNVFEFDANGATWKEIDGKHIGRSGAVTTREVSEYAKANGYNGVVIHNLVDSGAKTNYFKPSDIYILFDNKQVKSADAVTYDDSGNVIPLSQRFNTENKDIRYSLRNQQPTTRDILTQVDLSTRNKAEQHHLGKYQEQVELLADLEPRLAEANEKVAAIPVDDKSRREERLALLQEARVLKAEVNRLKRLTRAAEQSDMMRKIVAEEKLKAQKAEAKDATTIWEKEFVRVVKQYEKLDEKTGKRTIKDTATITKLQNALKAEAKAHKEDSAIWEKEFNRLLRDYETSGRQIERLEATIARQRATSKARVESRRKTEMRHKIQRKTDELNRLLLHGSKHRNVPEFLQPAVADILKAINMEVRDGEQRRKTYEANLARYDRQIAATSDPAKVTELIEKRNEYAAKGDQFANKMENLKKAYEEIEENKIPGMEIDEGLADRLNTLFTEVGDTPLGQMTEEQLEAVNEVLNITKATVRNANEMLAEARSAGVVETSKAAIAEIRRAGETKKTKTPLRKKLEQFGWNNLKPVYAFDVIGSKTLKDRYEALRRGEDTLAKDLSEAKNFFREQWKKNGGKDWDMDKKRKFTSTSGKSFELDLNQIMTLYALAKDKDARSHLRVGGFAFDSDYQTKEDINLGPVKIPVKVESADATAYNLSDEILGEIISTLTPQQRAFADAMQAYLSDTMAAKGNEVSLKKYGIRLFKKKDYFPIRVADQFMAKAREQQAGERKLKDSGFTKERKPEAKNPVVLSGFTEVWAEHVDEMSLYHSFVLPLDDFNRVLNYHDAFLEGQEAVSVVGAITNAFGKGATNYIDQLIKDVNGGIKGGSTVSFANNLMSKAKKAQTMASLSVAIQQPSSIIRAMSEVDGKYFIGPKVTEKNHDRTWDEIKKHAPIAIIKEMGGYDTNVGKSTVDYLTDTAEYDGFGEKFKAMFTDEKFRDDAFGRLPALMDEMAWGVIWNAVKREQRDLRPNMDTNSDAFMKLVANRFTEVITRTQVYDSVFSRSGLMRDKKSDLAKMVTSFMAEPTTTANMLAVSVLQASRGDIKGKQVAKTTASIVASLALNAALKSIIYALRDDDEDKRYDEKWVENFYSDFFESLNPIEYIPYVRDIYNLFVKGYDVNRADMELFGDLKNALDGLDNDELTAWEKTENVIGAIGNFLGVPVKNILRDVKGIVQTVGFAWDDKPNSKTKTGRYMARKGMDLTDAEQMILAIQRGDEAHIQRVFGRFESQEKAQSALQSAIGEQYREGNLTAEEAEKLLTDNFDRDDEHEIYWLLDKWDYTKEHGTDERWTKYGRFMEGVETGDFQAEMERLMEHGVDASDIRTQITRGYKKQYMEGDETTRQEIRNLLDPVYKATGMYPDEIQKKFQDWDFEAEFGMGYSEYRAEFRDGNITENELRKAMKFYGLKNYEIETDIRTLKDEIRFKNKFGMTMTEMQDSYDRGDVSRNTMINAKMFTGMTKTEAQKWITQRDISNQMGIDYAYLDDAYKYGDISRNDLRNAILKNGETVQNTDEAMLGYDWLKKNIKKYPDLGIDDAKKFAVRIHSDYAPDETLEDYGVSVEAYTEYQKLRPECKGVDANGDGKTDSGTLRDSVFAMIDSLPITSEAKDGLALMSYSARSIRRNAPWH